MVPAAFESLPLSPLQEGLWLFWKLNPTSSAYGMPEVFHFEGEFDPAAAETAFNAVVRRHEALRTTFHETPDGVVQQIALDPEPSPLRIVDLRELPAVEREGRLASVVTEESNRPFDLAAGPPVRLLAILVSETRTTLVLVAHHIVCDGTSMAVVLEDYGECYRAARRGATPELGPPPPGYSEFVRQQLYDLESGTLSEELSFWREKLHDVQGSALPGDGGDTSDDGGLGTSILPTQLDKELAAAVLSHAREAGATPFSVMLTAMMVMIASSSAKAEVTLGTVTSGRTPQFNETVGMLANTLALRSQIDLSRSFDDVLQTVADDLLDALDHQEVPFSRVVSELGDARAGAGLVRTMFGAGANGGLSLGEGKLLGIPASTIDGPFDLWAICYVEGSEIALDWEYALRTYSAETARAYCTAYLHTLSAALRRPSAPLNSLGIADMLPHVFAHDSEGEDLPAHNGAAATPSRSESAPSVSDRDLTSVSGSEPLTTREAQVAAIWSEVLDVPVKNPTDNFFMLGGHSMLATQTIAAVRSRVSRSATLRSLFEQPELRGFCARLDAERDEQGAASGSKGSSSGWRI